MPELATMQFVICRACSRTVQRSEATEYARNSFICRDCQRNNATCVNCGTGRDRDHFMGLRLPSSDAICWLCRECFTHALAHSQIGHCPECGTALAYRGQTCWHCQNGIGRQDSFGDTLTVPDIADLFSPVDENTPIEPMVTTPPTPPPDIYFCSSCNTSRRRRSSLHNIAGVGLVCNTCFEELFNECYLCGRSHRRDAMHVVQVGSYSTGHVCEECWNPDEYGTCDSCGRLHTPNNLTDEIPDRVLCLRCLENDYTMCSACEQYFSRADDDLVEISGRGYVCTNCYDRGNYYTCSNCDIAVHADDIREMSPDCGDCDDYNPDEECEYCDRGGEYLCPSCYYNRSRSGRSDRASYIHSYDYKPSAVFHVCAKAEKEGSRYGNIYYGIEIETDGYSRDMYAASAEIHRAMNGNINNSTVYLKSDGSLNNGIEFVFHPRTLRSWQEYLFGDDHWKNLHKAILENGGRSYTHRSCSVHVHRSKQDLDTTEQAKLITAMVKLEGHVVQFARRTSAAYASFNFWREVTDGKVKYVREKLVDGQMRNSRYVALNIRNRATVEFRVFKGTLLRDSIYSYLIFCDSLTTWVKGTGITNLIIETPAVLWAQYLEYMTKSYKPHPMFYRYLKKVRLLEDMNAEPELQIEAERVALQSLDKKEYPRVVNA